MGWKDWSYWLKGLIIALIIVIFYNLIFIFVGYNLIVMPGGHILIGLLAYSNFPIPLILGAFIGSIYGDIKNKKYNTNRFRFKLIGFALFILLIYIAFISVSNIR